MKKGCIYTYDQCRHNRMIDCEDKSKCKVCGWNPEVDRIRRGERKLERITRSGLPCYVLRDVRTGHQEFLMENPLYIGTGNSTQPIPELHENEKGDLYL